jgi:hypothetical protein
MRDFEQRDSGILVPQDKSNEARAALEERAQWATRAAYNAVRLCGGSTDALAIATLATELLRQSKT